MGCGVSKGPAPGPVGPGSPPQPAIHTSQGSSQAIESPDPRWDEAGFNRWLEECRLAWTKVGYLRSLAQEGEPLPARNHIPAKAQIIGVPPAGANLFSVTQAWQTPSHPDPGGFNLNELLKVLNGVGAADSDLVFYDWSSFWQKDDGRPDEFGIGRTIIGKGGRPDWQRDEFGKCLSGINRMFAFYRISQVVLCRMPAELDARGYFERGWTTFELTLAAYCQRIVNTNDPAVRDGLDPARFIDWKAELGTKVFTNNAGLELVLDRMSDQVSAMSPVADDAVGFATFCKESGIGWLAVAAAKRLAAAPGPFPRNQDLPPGAVIAGAPPAGARKFVLSHAWGSEKHPSPGGEKLRRLLKVLGRLGAKDSDVIFFDYISYPQKAQYVPTSYYVHNEGCAKPQADRTAAEDNRFYYALWDMGRLYAYKECEVVVLSAADDMEQFPGAPGAWGRVNTDSYHQRGWCCAEYSIAKYHGRIANATDAEVRETDRARAWPTTVDAYAEMMDESARVPVNFTMKGDREAVKYNFFKMCIGLQHGLAL